MTKKSLHNSNLRTFDSQVISYSWDSVEHQDSIYALSNRLRGDGIDSDIDQYYPSPEVGWPQWMERHIREADYVLVVCTEIYLQRFEGRE